ncbi:hypothetical protein PENVUL_c055G05782 [Penicillium vulpinum]|uniref:Uncharacterized protein n=1 Tax=Penicillium vulpinum TaxID=29845 RepID=A0A1V6RFM9_9EURO|nr:hypothetical protein PENVUL_c055G05782 [Penicillium vulpinum]
MSLGASVL